MARKASSLLSALLLGGAAGCFLLGAGVTVVDVVLRAVAGRNVPGAIEVTSFTIGLGALLSMPVCYTTRTHVTAKLVSELAPGRFARPFGVLGAAVSILFAAALLWIVAENTLSKLGSPETSPDLGLPVPALLLVVTATLVVALAAAFVGLWLELRKARA